MSWRKNRVPGQNLTSRDLTPVAELNAASVLSLERFLSVAAGGKAGPEVWRGRRRGSHRRWRLVSSTDALWAQVGQGYPGARGCGPTASPPPARVSTAVQVSSTLDCDTSYFNAAEQLQATENLFLSPFIRPGNLYRMQPACHYTTLKYYVLSSQNCRSITRQRKLLA